MKYYFEKMINCSFPEAKERTVEALKGEGFGVISEINITDKIREKLGQEFRNYLILGACNPSFAYKALQLEDKIGTMLPCNVIIQEVDHGKIEVAAVDPMASMMAIENSELGSIAHEVREKLSRVIESI
ncbi:MAG: DUF302 domain-containing protein [Bacteroidales bacterium]